MKRLWMHIVGILEATFYFFQKYAIKDGREAMVYGNTGLMKPMKPTQQATSTLKCILEKEADHMPHRTKTLKSAKKIVSVILSVMFQWKDQMAKINETNVTFELKVSTLNLSKIRSIRFLEFDVKKPRDNFA